MTTRPQRIRLSRRKGFDLQAASRALNGLAAVNCARPGPWGNPFVVGIDGTREECVRLHAHLLNGMLALTTKTTPEEQQGYREYLKANIGFLRGKNLACWCLGDPCHADALLEVANR